LTLGYMLLGNGIYVQKSNLDSKKADICGLQAALYSLVDRDRC